MVLRLNTWMRLAASAVLLVAVTTTLDAAPIAGASPGAGRHGVNVARAMGGDELPPGAQCFAQYVACVAAASLEQNPGAGALAQIRCLLRLMACLHDEITSSVGGVLEREGSRQTTP